MFIRNILTDLRSDIRSPLHWVERLMEETAVTRRKLSRDSLQFEGLARKFFYDAVGDRVFPDHLVATSRFAVLAPRSDDHVGPRLIPTPIGQRAPPADRNSSRQRYSVGSLTSIRRANAAAALPDNGTWLIKKSWLLWQEERPKRGP